MTEPQPPHLTATTPLERTLSLDVLRGVAVLGILLINVQLMASPRLVRAIFGDTPPDTTAFTSIVDGLLGVFVAGKFISSFSILFGVGAAIIATRALAHGRHPKRLLARRYALLIVAGLAHMLLLFPGDVLFIYGVTGLVLLPFLTRSNRSLLITTGLLLTLMTVAVTALLVASSLPTADTDAFAADVLQAADTGAAAYQAGSLSGVLTWHGVQAFIVQSDSLVSLPWYLALFLIGVIAYRRGYALEPATKRHELARIAKFALPFGVVLNLPLAFTGGFGTATVLQDTPMWLIAASGVAQMFGAPLLAVGYLASLTLLVVHKGAARGLTRRLAALGQIALTGYLLQSIAAIVVFVAFRQYGAFNTFSEPLLGELAFVFGVWTLLLLFAPWWTARFQFGPFEWLWRWGTYGQRPSFRRAAR